jgi:hypothetical protein
MNENKPLSIFALPSSFYFMGKKAKYQTTLEPLKENTVEKLQKELREVSLPALEVQAGSIRSKNTGLSEIEKELMQTFGKLSFSWETNWDERLEPAA